MRFSYCKNLLDLSDRSVFCFYGFHDCNSVHYKCGLMSIVLRLCLHYSRLIMISYADATLVGELLSISDYTVYVITFDGTCLTYFMTTATLIIYKQLMSMLSTCHYACILYSNRLMIRVDISEPFICI